MSVCINWNLASLAHLPTCGYFYRESVEYYHGNECLPVYGKPRKGYCIEEIVKILLSPKFQNNLLCTTHPISVQNNVSFVVDRSKLKDPNDVRADDLGAWKCNGSRLLRYTVKITDTDCHIVNEMSPNAIVINIRRQYHVHATDPDLHRMIAFLEDKNNKGKAIGALALSNILNSSPFR